MLPSAHILPFFLAVSSVLLTAHTCIAACGYESCSALSTDENVLNIHIVPHTHDDTGWLKTVDQYYYGANNSIYYAGVQYIISSVVSNLMENEDRRFTYVEMAFFERWYREQTDTIKQQVAELVSTGRLQFAGGGWCMNDEAAAHYNSIIDQMTVGHSFLSDTFGECGRPLVAWQIDPFGHSREQASIFAQMGMDGLFFARGHWRDMNDRLSARQMEMLWHGSDSLGSSSDLFTGWLYNHYSPPSGFCFDMLCSDEPINDDPRLEEYNVDRRINDFLSFVDTQAQYYATKNVIITMGDDFNYQAATLWFQNLDKLIKYVNQRSGYNAFYSTPACYLKALNDDTDRTWPEKSTDFFPYATSQHSYWAGFYTSRPTAKFYERLSNNLLQVTKQLTALVRSQRSVDLPTKIMKEVQGLVQHHDSITGTEKQHVADNYYFRLTQGWKEAQYSTSEALGDLVTLSSSSDKPTFTMCSQLNISVCDVSEQNSQFVVTVYNPLARSADKTVRLPVPYTSGYTVYDYQGNVVADTQIVSLPEEVIAIPGRVSTAIAELVFIATDLPPVGAHTFYVQYTAEETATQSSQIRYIDSEVEDFTIGDDGYQLQFDGTSRTVKALITDTATVALTHEMLYYEGHNNDGQASGAYIFRPQGRRVYDPNTDAVNATVITGTVVDEVQQHLSDWTSVVIRIYHGYPRIEFHWLAGPIPIDDNVGKEVISRFTADIDNNGKFITDSNGRQNMVRRRGAGTFGLPSYDPFKEEPIASNYYPVTAKIEIEDSDGNHLAVLNDRAEGGSSLDDGQVELMVHRRLLYDDGFGVSENLNEEAYGVGLVARGTHVLLYGEASSWTPTQQRLTQQELYDSPWLFFSATTSSYDDWRALYSTEFSGLNSALDSAVHLLTLEQWKDSTYLVRLENLYEETEGGYSGPTITVDLQNLFDSSLITVTAARETTLSANKWLEDLDRLVWNDNGSDDAGDLDITAVELKPMQIRTFIVGTSTVDELTL